MVRCWIRTAGVHRTHFVAALHNHNGTWRCLRQSPSRDGLCGPRPQSRSPEAVSGRGPFSGDWKTNRLPAKEQFFVIERRACKLLIVDRSTYRCEPRPDRNAQPRAEMIALSGQKPRYGCRATARDPDPTGPRDQCYAAVPLIQ